MLPPWHFYTGILLASYKKTIKHVTLYSDEHPMLLTPVIIHLNHKKKIKALFPTEKHSHKSVIELWVFWNTWMFIVIIEPAGLVSSISVTKQIQSTPQHISWKHPVILFCLLYLNHLPSGHVPHTSVPQPPPKWSRPSHFCTATTSQVVTSLTLLDKENTVLCVTAKTNVQIILLAM